VGGAHAVYVNTQVFNPCSICTSDIPSDQHWETGAVTLAELVLSAAYRRHTL
jgi:hypothetical protein